MFGVCIAVVFFCFLSFSSSLSSRRLHLVVFGSTLICLLGTTGMCRLVGFPVKMDGSYMRDMERVSRDAFLQMDPSRSGSISLKAFSHWVVNHRVIMEYLEHFTGRTNVFAAMEEVKRLLAVAMERFAGVADKNRVCFVVSSCF